MFETIMAVVGCIFSLAFAAVIFASIWQMKLDTKKSKFVTVDLPCRKGCGRILSVTVDARLPDYELNVDIARKTICADCEESKQ